MKKFSLLSLNALVAGKYGHVKNMKIFLLAIILCSISFTGFATVVVTPASGGSDICPNLAVGGGAPAFTSLGTIILTEGLTSDFSIGTDVLTLNLPAGWQFNTAVLPVLGFTAGGDVIGVGLAGGGFTSSSSFTIDISASGTTNFDQVTIAGLEVQATSGSSLPGDIYASLAGGLFGVTSGAGGVGTNFGSLSLVAGITPSVTISAAPAGAVCVATGVTFTPAPINGGPAPTYQWYVNGIFITTGTTFSSSTLTNGDEVTCVMLSSLACDLGTGTTSNTITMSIIPLPSVYSVTGGGAYCAGGSGADVTLAGSDVGVSYQLYFGGTPVGGLVAGTGGIIDFGPQTGTGASYTVVGSSSLTSGCTTNMAGSVTVTVTTAPTAYTITGGGSYCSGSGGSDVTLTGSDAGTYYQLLADGVAVGAAIDGGGSAIDFGNQIIAATYTATAYNPATGCSSSMIGSVAVAVNPLPAIFAVTGGGSYCSGGDGVDITLSGSEPTAEYQLFLGGSAVSGLVGGTGGPIDFGLVTGAGTYTIEATYVTTGCSAVAGTTTVTITALPNVYNMLGGGSYCSGGTGLDVSIDGSDAGVNYQLYNGSAAVGSAVAGTGSPLDFGLQTSAGSYNVIATDAVSGCSSTMTGAAAVVVNPLPEAFGVVGGGATCTGGFGISVSQVGSTLGINYQLYLGGVPVGAPVPGTGGYLDYGAETAAGVYTAIGTDATSGCASAMDDSAVVSLIPAPVQYNVTGGTIGYCVGGAGVDVGLSHSDIGVNYQLFLNGTTTVGGLVPGTDLPLDFGLQTTMGTYTIVATNATTFCDATMIGTAVVAVNPLPTAFTMTGGGNYCVGGSGAIVSLSGSSTAVKYQLYFGASAVGSPIAGTGTTLSFGLQTGVGTYTAVATDTITGCVSDMTGTSTVDTISLPTLYSVTGGGSYCTGGTGVAVGLNGSDLGVNYRLFNIATAIGTAVAGTGSAISFPTQTATGFYTVMATNPTSTCTSNMSGGVAVTILPLPTVYNVYGGGAYCVGGAGVDISLNGSVVGVNYQLFDTTAMIGTAVAGSGSVIDFGLQLGAGTYTVVATDASSLCTSNMADSAVVVINQLPTTYTMAGGGAICAGTGAGVDLSLGGSQSGVSYQLYVGGAPVSTAQTGTGSALDFGFQTLAGVYTVLATNISSSCAAYMTGSDTITLNPAPTAYPVIGGGAYCTGGSGLHVGMGGSDLGISYLLYLGGIPTGITAAGTGGSLDFGPQTAAGLYTAVGTNPFTGCSGPMGGDAIIVVSPSPSVYTVTGGGNYCAGGAGDSVGLSSSDLGISYQLYLGGVAVSIPPVAGTGGPIFFGIFTATGTYTVIATNAAAGCIADMGGSAIVSTSLAPNVYSISGGGSSCGGGVAYAISLRGSDLGINYQLYNGAVALGSPQPGTGGALAFGSFTAPGTYKVIATDTATGCTASMSGTAVITTIGYPVVSAISGVPTLCEFSTDLFSDPTPGGTWRSGTTGIATITSGGTVTGVSTGVTTISYTVTTSGCTTMVSTNVTVLTTPVVPAITGTASTCEGLTSLLSDAVSGGVWSSSNTFVATVSSTGIVSAETVVSSANISYTVTNASGCSASTLVPFTVVAAIPASTILPLHSATLCGGNPVDLNVVITGGTSGYAFQWFDSGIAIPSAVADTYVASTPGMYTVEISNSACNLTLPDTTVVLSPPNPVITYDTAASMLVIGSFTTIQWFRNDTEITGATTDSLPYGVPGSYTVVVSDTNGCPDTSAAFIILPDTTNTYVNPLTFGKNVKIYPNPVTSILNIDAPVKVLVTITTIDGQVLIGRKEAISLNVSDLADGMYMIMVYDENNNLLKTEKFVKMQ